MNRTSGTPGTDANSIIKAEAIAAHILYNLTVDKFTFTPGIRYEDIKLNSLNYGTNVSRAGTTLAKANKDQRMDPRFRILYKISDD
jgi:Fe(3+) dicitrate transport protein